MLSDSQITQPCLCISIFLMIYMRHHFVWSGLAIGASNFILRCEGVATLFHSFQMCASVHDSYEGTWSYFVKCAPMAVICTLQKFKDCAWFYMMHIPRVQQPLKKASIAKKKSTDLFMLSFVTRIFNALFCLQFHNVPYKAINQCRFITISVEPVCLECSTQFPNQSYFWYRNNQLQKLLGNIHETCPAMSVQFKKILDTTIDRRTV